MYHNFTHQFAGATGTDAKKTMSPSLRSDLYSIMDKVKSWMIGGLGSGQAGDGVSYGPLLVIIQKHFPNTKLGLESIRQTEGEVGIIVGGVTNMVLEMSKWEGMASAMAMRTWIEALVESHRRLSPGTQKDNVARGIAKGVNQNVDTVLMTKEFTARIQLVSSLKTVSSRLYGSGTDEARSGEAFWNSKLL